MLIRLGLAVKDKPLAAHLARKLSDADIRLESFHHSKNAWQKVMRSGCDVIVISKALGGCIPSTAAMRY